MHYIDLFARELAEAGRTDLAQVIEFGACNVQSVSELTGMQEKAVELADYFVLRFPDKDVIFEHTSPFGFTKIDSIPAKRSCMMIEHIVQY